jgi:hypothetical protein
MRQVFVFGLAISAVLASVAPAGRAQAQQPVAALRTVAGSHGYQFQAPADWRDLPGEALSFSVDANLASPNGEQVVAIGVFPASGATVDDLPRLAGIFTGGVAQQQAAAGGSVPSFSEGPDPIQVPNADAAVGLLETFSDSQGRPMFLAAHLAIQGSWVFVFTLTASEAAFKSDPTFGSVLASFQLSPPAVQF